MHARCTRTACARHTRLMRTTRATARPLHVHLMHGWRACVWLCALQERLCLENTLWTNSVLASGVATVVVIYTGRDTRAATNSARPRTKTASIDLQAPDSCA